MPDKKSLEQLLNDLIECVHEDKLVLGATPDGRPHDPDPEIDRLRKEILSRYGQPQHGAAWVKASEFKYELEVIYHAKFSDTDKGAGYFNDDDGGGHIFVWQDGADTFQTMFPKLLILDEANEQPVEQKENDAVEFIQVFAPCLEDDPRQCGAYTSNDGQSLCYVREFHVPASAEQLYSEYKKQNKR